MSIFSRFFLGGVEGVGQVANSIVKTVWGSKQERDIQDSAEQMSVMESLTASLMPRANATYWDSFIDGINRLPRPLFTFGIVYIFGYCLSDPIAFTASMNALRLMPDYGWALMGTVTVFWFGGKYMRDVKKPSLISAEQVASVLKTIEEIKKLQVPDEDKEEEKTEPLA